VLYGMFLSPPCVKIRVILDYYQVKFTVHEGKKPDSEYTKIPVLDVGDVQINDSFSMVCALAPLLQGTKLTPKEIELEKLTTFGLMLALEVETVQESCGQGLRKCGWNVAPRLSGCFPYCICCCFTVCGPCLGCAVGGGMKDGFEKKCEKHTGAALKTAAEYAKEYAEILGGQEFFYGNEAGIVDLSLYGVLMPFAEAGVQAALDFLDNPAMQTWYTALKEKAGTEHFAA